MSSKPTSSTALDPGLFLEPPQLDTAGMLALGRALVYLAPTEPPQEIFNSLRRLKQAWEDLNSAGKAARDPSRHESSGRQPADVVMDNAWTALYERLRAFAMLPEAEVPRVRRAHDLLRLLYPDALGFLKLPYEQEWAESGNRLRLIERLKLADEINALAGPEFLAQVRRAHDTYGKVLGIAGESTPDSSSESAHVRELRAALGRAISHYALKVVSMSDDDPVQARRLLAPLAEHHRLGERRPSYNRPTFESRPASPAPTAPNLSPHTSGDRWAAINRPSDSGLFRINAPAPESFRAPASDSGSFRTPSEPGSPRPLTDAGSAPHRDSGFFRIKKPSE